MAGNPSYVCRRQNMAGQRKSHLFSIDPSCTETFVPKNGVFVI